MNLYIFEHWLSWSCVNRALPCPGKRVKTMCPSIQKAVSLQFSPPPCPPPAPPNLSPLNSLLGVVLTELGGWAPHPADTLRMGTKEPRPFEPAEGLAQGLMGTVLPSPRCPPLSLSVARGKAAPLPLFFSSFIPAVIESALSGQCPF